MSGHPLCGRVERVYLDCKLNNQLATGLLGDQNVYVVNGADYVGKEVLARFCLEHSGHKVPQAHFLAIYPPSFPTSLPFDSYVLCGLWDEGIETVPGFMEVQQRYNPGKKDHLLFVEKEAEGHRGKYRILPRGHNLINSTLRKSIRLLPDPNENARLVIAQGEKQLQKVIASTMDLQLMPIVLEPTILL